MTSIGQRLQITLGACLLLAVGVLWFAGARLLEAVVRELVAERLARDAETLLAGLRFDADGAPRWERVDPAFEHAFSGRYFVLRTSGGVAYDSRSWWDEQPPASSVTVGEICLRQLPGPQGQRLLARGAGYRKRDRDFTLTVLEDLAAADRYRACLSWSIAGFALGSMLLVALAQQAVLRASLRPLERVRAELGALKAGRAEQLSEQVPVEILPLVREVNRLLSSLARRHRPAVTSRENCSPICVRHYDRCTAIGRSS